jgi:hypothetical protein
VMHIHSLFCVEVIMEGTLFGVCHIFFVDNVFTSKQVFHENFKSMGTFGIGTLLSKWNGVCNLICFINTLEVRWGKKSANHDSKLKCDKWNGCLGVCFDFKANCCVISNTWSSNIQRVCPLAPAPSQRKGALTFIVLDHWPNPTIVSFGQASEI